MKVVLALIAIALCCTGASAQTAEQRIKAHLGELAFGNAVMAGELEAARVQIGDLQKKLADIAKRLDEADPGMCGWLEHNMPESYATAKACTEHRATRK